MGGNLGSVRKPARPEISVWLCNNPEQIAQINNSKPQDVSRLFGKLEGYVEAAMDGVVPDRPAARPAPTVSRAPRPVSTVSGRSHAHNLSPDDMSYDQYKAWRMKDIARRR